MTTLREYSASRELVTHLTLRELRGKYKRSALGWGWSLLNPLSTMVIFTLVFRLFFRIDPPRGEPSGLTNFALFLLCGLLPWNFLTSGVFGSIGALVGNANLIKKTYFPRELLIGAQVASWVVSLLIEFGLLAIVLLVVGNMVVPYLPVVVFLLFLLAVFVTGLGLAMSIFNVFFRDVQHFVGILFQAWFYLTPVVYPLSLVPERVDVAGAEIPLRSIYRLNPMVGFTESFRDCLYHLRAPSLGRLAYLVVAAAVSLTIGLLVFSKLEGRLAEEL